MKAGIVFSGSGPILILTTGDDLVGEKEAGWLAGKSCWPCVGSSVPTVTSIIDVLGPGCNRI